MTNAKQRYEAGLDSLRSLPSTHPFHLKESAALDKADKQRQIDASKRGQDLANPRKSRQAE